ncbi:MAG: hypothetical protein XD85_0058 [Parcubacteria bacterium 34_609]|jgi:hypothetical protein|nr:MAG: hypothetical protein XD85_0058 [Parcubacteria bacterium 34_609]KUK99447.1 MAG: hypothetical protein XE08_0040 [Parcubacteria bacterium 32_520]
MDNYNTTQYWAAIAPFIASIIALFIAICGDALRKIFIKPSLVFSSVNTIIHKETKLKGIYYMYRLLVRNKNGVFIAPAENVRASIIFANKKLPLPIPLTWTYIDKDTRNISKGESAYLDVIQASVDPYIHKFYSKIKIDEVINSPEYILPNVYKTKIQIAFFEKNSELKIVDLELDPVEKTLKVL